LQEKNRVYLKALEMVGFKSFAEKTKLMFEPGMTSIVGPNGCGKSNVSDAIRWVLGEQSAKALRGAKMEDCIFNGTQNRKPLGMAEVNITFTDCENVLPTEYHEVTITRRVFRSGEGQYFINKTPCRLKDVQRLFMDTGVGTSSYSFMAQGRIDQILSARPEDRRAIFEEASGITKFKRDKNEAIRKLDHTEANLLRLADVIREVKRQIGSLQRQAGKAKRYKTHRDELRALDLYASGSRLIDFEKATKKLQSELDGITEQISAAHHDVEAREARNVALREEILSTEREIAGFMESGMQAQSRLDRTQDLIRINTQRIDEYQKLSERDTRELGELQRQLADRKEMQKTLEEQITTCAASRDVAKHELDLCTQNHESHRQQIDTARQRIQQLRNESVALEDQASKIHNQLLQIESQERSTLIQRERLAAEKQQLSEVASTFAERLVTFEETLTQHRRAVDAALALSTQIDEKQRENLKATRETQQMRSEHQSARARRQTTIELLSDAEEVQGDFPGGTKLLLDPENPLGINRDDLLGALAEHIVAPAEYAHALEAALRSVLDAIVVKDNPATRALLSSLSEAEKGAARLITLPATVPNRPAIPDGMRMLADLVEPADEAYRTLTETLLGHVAVADSLEEIPSPIPAGLCFVTRKGLLLRDNGVAEFWMGDPGATNPLSRKHAIAAAQQAATAIELEIAACETTLTTLQEESESLVTQAADARQALDEARRQLAQKEGESQMVARESKTASARLETVTWELEEITGKGSSWDAEKQSLLKQQTETREARERSGKSIGTQNGELQQLETRYVEIQTELTEKRVAFGTSNHRVEHLTTQLDSVTTRLSEIDASLQGRSEGLLSYESNIEQLKKAIANAEAQLSDLESAVTENADKAKELRTARVEKSEGLVAQEAQLSSSREALENQMKTRSELDIRMTEMRMRCQNLTDRVTTDYNLTVAQILDEPEPEWDEEAMSVDDAETRVAELRTKLEAMGPVNLVAIEEYKEHEERYTFLTQQEDDLVKAKEQLLEMIKTINRTTSEMFKETFEQANTNFQAMFNRLFNGGSAKLVLVNEEDVLECGIEIIARPPGKRLQNISLLSGGERTLTAVALLFSIYQIKPSPFCMLDELDAPLDDTNIGRFTEILKEFLQQSQFVVITHNRQTIAAAHILYGVTMPERGVSRIMSMKFKDADGGVLTDEAIGAKPAKG
jgi:chromosome segregation protein